MRYHASLFPPRCIDMCGVVSIVYKDTNKNIGREAANLLRRLEYRGYDSTGASFIDKDRNIALAKKTGAPSKVVKELGIEGYSGVRFIGQVRWATYGSVSDVNSQPHHVKCRYEIVGAHNGNISNTDSLKKELTEAGHRVVSDNDGEIVVHLVEEQYAANRKAPAAVLAEARAAWKAAGLEGSPPDDALLLAHAARAADARADGSYAACVADPAGTGVVAVKSGSSLYAGVGTDDAGPFVVVSSDLSSVLSKTRYLIPLSEGEGLWFDHDDWFVFTLGGALRLSKPKPKRSKLNVQDTALDPKYRYFMEQEIRSSPANIDEIVRYYFRDPGVEALEALFEERSAIASGLVDRFGLLSGAAHERELIDAFRAILADEGYRALAAREFSLAPDRPFVSDERRTLEELAALAPDASADLRLADALLVWEKRRAVIASRTKLADAIRDAGAKGGRVYFLASGTSYHAALSGACFFDHLAKVPVFPCNPGQFRSMYLDCLSPADLVVGITQSGETKDLVDVFVDVRSSCPDARRVALVNNENSRIPQELCDFYLPILCGPETAVAATKSFVNQLAILYLVAAGMAMPDGDVIAKLGKAGGLIAETLAAKTGAIDEAAARLAMKSSLHILGTSLIGLAREGALKIREVVLNHTEGYDTAEFKHGPNTILGKNTVFDVTDLGRLLDGYNALLATDGAKLSAKGGRDILATRPDLLESLFSDYPLVFVCPPDARDERITISQIHTHKIRGADTILFAERNPELALAVEGKPEGVPRYWSTYIELPASGDRDLFVFAASAALQYFAFRMSVIKKEALDALGVADHGVHPDAPKNVSKSITVD